MTSVKKQWGNTLITIQQERLDQIKELIWKHGINKPDVVAQIIENEMARQPYDEEVTLLVTITTQEVVEQREGYLRAIKDLRTAAEVANTGPERSPTLWAVYGAAADFLEGQMT